MRSLYLRIWLTVVVALALFALGSGWMFQRHMAAERERSEIAAQQRLEAWADMLQRSLPAADAPREDQAQALRDWSQRLRIPMALEDTDGQRIGASESYLRREAEGLSPRRVTSVRLADGRTLWLGRPGMLRRTPPGEALDGPSLPADLQRPDPFWPPDRSPMARLGGPEGPPLGRIGPDGVPLGRGGPPGRGDPERPLQPWTHLPGLPEGTGIVVLLGSLFLGVAAGAYPVVRRLTRRLEALKRGVEVFGAGQLHHRVDDGGRDEVAAVAASFNEAAARIEKLLHSNQSLLANASHELRSPLARLKMAVSMMDGASPQALEALRTEVHTNIAELDALVEEILLASRLEAGRDQIDSAPVDLLALVAEEGARVHAEVQGEATIVPGDERLLRRAVRNLLENARRYGRDEVLAQVEQQAGMAIVRISDRGPGVPAEFRERIFEAFFRLPGHAEREGGVGLGLALVRQIAERHHGQVRCEQRDGGGSCFTLRLPLSRPTAPLSASSAG